MCRPFAFAQRGSYLLNSGHSVTRSMTDVPLLDVFVFQTLNEVREQTEMWLREYNEESSHMTLWER